MSFSFAHPRARRKPSLTPMIDVVFLLLVFFMLAARFGQDLAIPIRGGAGGASSYSGPPRLVVVRPDGARLNGVLMTPPALMDAVARLTQSPEDAVVIRPEGGVDLQALVDVMTGLRAAGHTRLILIEGAP